MKYLKKCPLLVMLAFSILIYEVLAGVPKVLAFAEAQANKKEYRVEILPEYSAVDGGTVNTTVSGGGVSGNTVSDNSVSGNSVSGNNVSGNNVSGNDVSGNSVSENQVSGNQVSGNENISGSVSGNGASLLPAAEYVQVGDEYFADALFIGDSRTVGLAEYSGMEQATFYASTGLMVHKVFDSEIVSVSGSKKKITIEEALTQRQFGKIYFMIGINEMGRGTVDTFMAEYEGVIARLQELQPNAIIYVQAIMRVSTERSEKGDYIHNQGIDERNERIAQLADNQRIFYLDVNPLISDETGGLNKNFSFDGVHLKAEYIPIWTDFLATHGIVQ